MNTKPGDFDCEGFRYCPFCGCHTNAAAMDCCNRGRDWDKARCKAESSIRYDICNAEGKFLVSTGYDIEGESYGWSDKPDDRGWGRQSALELSKKFKGTPEQKIIETKPACSACKEPCAEGDNHGPAYCWTCSLDMVRKAADNEKAKFRDIQSDFLKLFATFLRENIPDLEREKLIDMFLSMKEKMDALDLYPKRKS